MTPSEALSIMCQRCLNHHMCMGTGCLPKKTLEESIRPKGKWIEAIDTGTEMLECSVCECRVKKKSYAESVGTDGYNYCPYCGSYNGGKDDGDE